MLTSNDSFSFHLSRDEAKELLWELSQGAYGGNDAEEFYASRGQAVPQSVQLAAALREFLGE